MLNTNLGFTVCKVKAARLTPQETYLDSKKGVRSKYVQLGHFPYTKGYLA